MYNDSWRRNKSKSKSKSIYFNEALCHDIWGTGGRALPFLTLTVNGSESAASHPSCLTMQEQPLVPIECIQDARAFFIKLFQFLLLISGICLFFYFDFFLPRGGAYVCLPPIFAHCYCTCASVHIAVQVPCQKSFIACILIEI
jgi:hypothetical protein